MTKQSSQKVGKLLEAWESAGRTKQEFFGISPEKLNDTEETQLRSAGVEASQCLQFLERFKGMVGEGTFAAFTGDFRDRMIHQRSAPDFKGERIKNPTGTFINLCLSKLRKEPELLGSRGKVIVLPQDNLASPPPVYSKRDRMLLRKIEVCDSIQKRSAAARDSIGFSSRSLVQASLPHSDPGPIDFWQRRNGRFIFVLEPGLARNRSTGELYRAGCPYGSFPRLVIIHLASEALRTKNRRIHLGRSFCSFLHTLGVSDSVKNYAAMHQQMTRLFASHVSYHWTESLAEAKALSSTLDVRSDERIAKRVALWSDPEAMKGDGSFVELSQDFYDEILEHGFPVDMDAVAALKKSSLALDIYLWLTWRMVDLRYSFTIPWIELHEQFGADYTRIRKFREKFAETVTKVSLFWRGGLKHEVTPDGLVIAPSPLPVERRSAS